MGIPKKMRDYIQESRRVGQNGLKSKAIIIRAQQTGKDKGRIIEQGQKVDKLIKELILNKNYRRIALNKEIDGRTDRLGYKIGKERYNIYKGKPRGIKRRKSVVGNKGATLNKRLDAAIVDSSKQLGSQSGSQLGSELGSISKIIDKDGDGSNAEVIKLEGNKNNRLEENKGDIDIQDKFMAERQRQDIIQQRRIKRHIQERLRIKDLPRQFKDQKNSYIIYKARHGGEINHKWENYVDAEGVKIIERWVRIIERVQFQQFLRYNSCWVPQHICHSWEENKERGQGF